jgi:hypothetical protein
MRLLFPILVLALLAPVLASQAVITSVFKPPVTGKVVKVDVQGRLEVAVEGSEVPERIPLDEIEEVNFGQQGDERKPADAPLRVYLVNGDVLYGTPDVSPDGDEESFVLRGKRFTDIRIRNDAVSRIEYVANVQPNTLPDLAADEKVDVVHWAAVGETPAQVDRGSELVRVTKDGVWLYNATLDGDKYEGVKYDWNRIRGIVCYRPRYKPFDKLMGIFTLRDGTILSGVLTSWGEGKLKLEHTALKGRRATDKVEIALEEANLISISMKNGKYIYLSDMEFAETPKERPFYLPADFNYDEYLFKIRRDQAQGGGAISMRGKVYPKGLGVHAISSVTYDLNRGYKRFLCDIGVDDSAGELASVEFKVYVDGKLVYESGVLLRSSPVKTLDIDVLNARQIKLEVLAADNADIQDRANWANAKLVR